MAHVNRAAKPIKSENSFISATNSSQGLKLKFWTYSCPHLGSDIKIYSQIYSLIIWFGTDWTVHHLDKDVRSAIINIPLALLTDAA